MIFTFWYGMFTYLSGCNLNAAKGFFIVLNAKPHVDVEQVILETAEPVTVGVFLLRELLQAERALCTPPPVSEPDMRRAIRSWGMASYAGMTVAAGAADLIVLNLIGHSCRHLPSYSFAGMASVEVPVDLFVLASRIVAVRAGLSQDDECGLRMAFNRGMSSWVFKNAPAPIVASVARPADAIEARWPSVGIRADHSASDSCSEPASCHGMQML